MIKKITATLVVLVTAIFALYLYYFRIQSIDPALVDQLEASIPECAMRDKASEIMASNMKLQNRSYYYVDELEDYDRKAKKCLEKFSEAFQKHQQR